MLCRDADSCFWIGRYIERAEATARTLDVHYHFGLESNPMGTTAQWSSLLAISGHEDGFVARYADETERNILQFFLFDDDNPGSVKACLRVCRENARSIREQISSEMWESLNQTYLGFRDWNVERALEGAPHECFQWVKNASHLFQGITNRTLMMGESRDFLDAGRFLERADQTARILDVKYHDLLPRFAPAAPELAETVPAPAGAPDPLGVGGPVDVHGWISVLKSVGAYEAFRKAYHEVTPTSVAGFLILSQRFPASIRHSIARVDGCMRRVSGNAGPSPANAAEREIGKLYSQLNFITAEEIIADGLHEFLEYVQERCNEIGAAISETYLKY
jgi:uncharacterized alpha-E superfamily protein